ncbi:hypothetical protein LO771_21185 [Streptacidiphilus sp. ASG 303]|uniref:hypothetical protein n=1 Tax=Streptacidiphilus sp. ASG 303 TaxID=2896847 RepID=UPI001E35E718|nr:hypothetical protein [Streptacidiphilus sp. ASG 303]MCD0484837.1 hypothetical protein [Streptacidiphilus sp. ASG 303]
MASRTRPRRVPRRAVAATAVLVLGGTGAYGAQALTDHGRSRHPRAAAAPSAQTTRVRRTDLSDTQTLPGTLAFGRRTTVKGTGNGVVTGLPAPGAHTVRGKPLYWVDDQPVTVFLGAVPFFRPLNKPGQAGRDVTVLVENLRALGYDIGPPPPAVPLPRYAPTAGDPGTRLTPGVLAALKRWQHDTGQPATGTLDPGRFAVLQGPSRVDTVLAHLGDPAAQEVLALTSEQKTVTVKADAQSAGSIHRGDRVEILLPDTRTVPGKVLSIGTTVQGGADDPSGASPDQAPTLQVSVVPTRAADVAAIDAASVQVLFTGQSRKHVLVVPVGALLALSEGGYALQRPDGQLVGIRTGMYARGLVEVSSDRIKEGDLVVTAS